tara:strand:- start:611 stop:895 length:285 start_codon:yes stop_codon:yes gene_type:complete
MVKKQQRYLEEEIKKREAKGDTGVLAKMGALKDVMMRIKREAQVGVVRDNSDDIFILMKVQTFTINILSLLLNVLFFIVIDLSLLLNVLFFCSH